MAMGDGGCSLWQPVQADSQPKSSGLVLGRRPLGAIPHPSNEPGELSQWLCHDDSTIKIVVLIIIIIIIASHRLVVKIRPTGLAFAFLTCYRSPDRSKVRLEIVESEGSNRISCANFCVMFHST